MPPDPPSAGMLRMPVFAHYECKYVSNQPYINNDDRSGCAPPFSKVQICPCIVTPFVKLIKIKSIGLFKGATKFATLQTAGIDWKVQMCALFQWLLCYYAIKPILLHFLKWHAREEAIVLAPLDIPKSVSGHINHHYDNGH